MLKYKILNRYDISADKLVSVESGPTGYQQILGKAIAIPFSTRTRDNGYSDLVNEFFLTEKSKITNTFTDNETFKFRSASSDGSETLIDTKLKIWFYDETNPNFAQNNYLTAGFTSDEINFKFNNFKNSFFRLDFYDSNNQREQNYLFSEFFYPDKNPPEFSFNRIFYKKEDPKFVNDNTFIELYFDVTFFDAKTGLVKNLINLPPTPNPSLTLDQYNSNTNLRYAKIKILNPYFDQPSVGSLNKIFYVESVNGNTDSQINFSEFKII